jgi:hypothetical protein
VTVRCGHLGRCLVEADGGGRESKGAFSERLRGAVGRALGCTIEIGVQPRAKLSHICSILRGEVS